MGGGELKRSQQRAVAAKLANSIGAVLERAQPVCEMIRPLSLALIRPHR